MKHLFIRTSLFVSLALGCAGSNLTAMHRQPRAAAPAPAAAQVPAAPALITFQRNDIEFRRLSELNGEHTFAKFEDNTEVKPYGIWQYFYNLRYTGRGALANDVVRGPKLKKTYEYAPNATGLWLINGAKTVGTLAAFVGYSALLVWAGRKTK